MFINKINKLSTDSAQTRKMHGMDEGRTAITISLANDGCYEKASRLKH
jgi:hypothetical protein